mmetsp:Transcript_34985/g.100432  ORF Transcript_34985/g.100432 Transcript_34985/m.100432 type:complete len:375 (-) Transcript_34985:81-1205(-)
MRGWDAVVINSPLGSRCLVFPTSPKQRANRVTESGTQPFCEKIFRERVFPGSGPRTQYWDYVYKGVPACRIKGYAKCEAQMRGWDAVVDNYLKGFRCIVFRTQLQTQAKQATGSGRQPFCKKIFRQRVFQGSGPRTLYRDYVHEGVPACRIQGYAKCMVKMLGWVAVVAKSGDELYCIVFRTPPKRAPEVRGPAERGAMTEPQGERKIKVREKDTPGTQGQETPDVTVAGSKSGEINSDVGTSDKAHPAAASLPPPAAAQEKETPDAQGEETPEAPAAGSKSEEQDSDRANSDEAPPAAAQENETPDAQREDTPEEPAGDSKSAEINSDMATSNESAPAAASLSSPAEASLSESQMTEKTFRMHNKDLYAKHST